MPNHSMKVLGTLFRSTVMMGKRATWFAPGATIHAKRASSLGANRLVGSHPGKSSWKWLSLFFLCQSPLTSHRFHRALLLKEQLVFGQICVDQMADVAATSSTWSPKFCAEC